MILISTSLALISIALGGFLLAKSRQENLGGLFKFISWFVVAMGFLCLVCIGFRGIRHCGMGGGHCGKKMHCERGYEGGNHCMRDRSGCEGKAEGCEREMKKDCCKKGGEEHSKCMKDSLK